MPLLEGKRSMPLILVSTPPLCAATSCVSHSPTIRRWRRRRRRQCQRWKAMMIMLLLMTVSWSNEGIRWSISPPLPAYTSGRTHRHRCESLRVRAQFGSVGAYMCACVLVLSIGRRCVRAHALPLFPLVRSSEPMKARDSSVHGLQHTRHQEGREAKMGNVCSSCVCVCEQCMCVCVCV